MSIDISVGNWGGQDKIKLTATATEFDTLDGFMHRHIFNNNELIVDSINIERAPDSSYVFEMEGLYSKRFNVREYGFDLGNDDKEISWVFDTDQSIEG